MNKKNLIGGLVIIAFVIAIGYFVPLTLVLGNQELTNAEYSFQLNLFQGILYGGAIVCLILLLVREFMIKDKKYGDSFGLFNIGESVPYLKKFTAIQLTLYLSTFFSILFLIASRLKAQNFYYSVKYLPQQFTPGESIAFSSSLIPFAEEMMALAVLGILLLILVILAIKYKIPLSDYRVYKYVIIPVIIGVLAILWHGSAYPGDDTAKIVIFVFWLIKTELILLTDFIITGLLFHFFNNFSIDFSRLFTSDATFYFVLTILIIQIVIIVVIYRNRLLGSTKKSEVILQ